MAYDVFSIDKMQINASGLRKFARKCISESNSRVSIMAKPYITGVYDLSKILYENNPHVYLNPTEKLRMGEYVKDGDCYIVGPNLMIGIVQLICGEEYLFWQGFLEKLLL